MALPSSPTAGGVYLVLVLLGLLAVAVLERHLFPLGRCRWCRGRGKWRSPLTRGFRECPFCGGKSARRRRMSGKGKR